MFDVRDSSQTLRTTFRIVYAGNWLLTCM